VPPQSGAGVREAKNNLVRERALARWIPPSAAGFAVSSFLSCHPGRAPPSEVPLS
jgi:hypothetical protein